MKSFLFFASLAFVAIGATSVRAGETPETAQPANSVTKGFYASLSAGAAYSIDPNYVFSGSGTAYDVSNTPLHWDTDSQGLFGVNGGISTEAAIGYRFGNQFRGEVSYVYNRIGVDTGTTRAVATTGSPFSGDYTTSGSVATNSVFASVYYDFPVKSKFVPYVGLGLGWTNTTVDTGGYSYAVTSNGTFYSGSGTATGASFSSFGYQAKAGVSYNYTPSSSFFLEGVFQGNSGSSASNQDGLTYLSGFNSFGVRAGFRYQFGR